MLISADNINNKILSKSIIRTRNKKMQPLPNKMVAAEFLRSGTGKSNA